jgi:hypothetical protein
MVIKIVKDNRLSFHKIYQYRKSQISFSLLEKIAIEGYRFLQKLLQKSQNLWKYEAWLEALGLVVTLW